MSGHYVDVISFTYIILNSKSSLRRLVMVALLVLLVVVSLTVYYLATKGYDFWKKNGIPYEQPLPFIGNIGKMVLGKQSIGQFLQEMYRNHPGEPYVGAFLCKTPVLIVRDYKLVKSLVFEGNNLGSRAFYIDRNIDPIFGNGVFALPPSMWKPVRSSLTPGFTPTRMRHIFSALQVTVDNLLELVERSQTQDIRELTWAFAVDALSKGLLGIDSKALTDPNDGMLTLSKDMFSTDLTHLASKFLLVGAPPLYSALKLSFCSKKVYNYLRLVVEQVVKVRKCTGSNKYDLLGMLEELKAKGKIYDKNGHEFEFEGDNVVSQIFTFMVAGFDTTSAAMTHTLYELAVHQDAQTRLRSDLRARYPAGPKDANYDNIHDVKYLDMVVNEALRKHPSFPLLDRTCTKDFKLPGTEYVMKKGTLLYVSMWGLHMDEQYWPKPDIFDPERFKDEDIKNKPFFPFGEGPRQCMGLRFAYMEIKMLLVALTSRYSWRLAVANSPYPGYDPYTYTCLPAKPIQIVFESPDQSQ